MIRIIRFRHMDENEYDLSYDETYYDLDQLMRNKTVYNGINRGWYFTVFSNKDSPSTIFEVSMNVFVSIAAIGKDE